MSNLYNNNNNNAPKPYHAVEGMPGRQTSQWPGLAVAPPSFSITSLTGLHRSVSESLTGSFLPKCGVPGGGTLTQLERATSLSKLSLLSAPFPSVDLSSRLPEVSSTSRIGLHLAPDRYVPTTEMGLATATLLRRQIREEANTPPPLSRAASLDMFRSSLQSRRIERLAEIIKLQREDEVSRALLLSLPVRPQVGPMLLNRKRPFTLSSMQEQVLAPEHEGSFAPAMKKPRYTNAAHLAGMNHSSQQQFLPVQKLVSEAHTPQQAKEPKSKMLSMACDEDSLTPYQCLARKQIELFAADMKDVEAKGRNRAIVEGQVGIRCIHCAHLPARERTKGSTIYPSKWDGIYQAAQNMSNAHLSKYCRSIPSATREQLLKHGNKKSSAGGGRDYWSTGAKILGVGEDTHGLCFNQGGSA